MISRSWEYHIRDSWCEEGDLELTINERMKGRESTTYMEENINRTYIGKEKWNQIGPDWHEKIITIHCYISSALTKIHGYLT